MLKVTDINKYYATQHILKNVCLEGNRGNMIRISGASGEGKTTLLRCICGLEKFKSGTIEINGKVVQSENVFTPPYKRKIGLVFQDLALWPHMTVWQNVDFVSAAIIRNKKERNFFNEQLLSEFKIDHKKTRFPGELSGGEQQRVALARAMANKPQILLLDEPFSNLDKDLANELTAVVTNYVISNNLLLIMVSHSDNHLLNWGTISYRLINKELKQIHAQTEKQTISI